MHENQLHYIFSFTFPLNFPQQKGKPEKICSTHLEMMEFSRLHEELKDPCKDNTRSKWLSMREWRKRLYTEGAILAIDEYSLILFPLSFAIFNGIYWVAVVNEPESALVDS